VDCSKGAEIELPEGGDGKKPVLISLNNKGKMDGFLCPGGPDRPGREKRRKKEAATPK